MTPEEKAIEITKKFGYAAGSCINDLVLGIAKRSAIICCDEVLKSLMNNSTSTEPYLYWQQVKDEIQKL